jgi:hypothetical protein
MSKLLPQCTANEAVILRADYIADFNAGRGGAYGRKLAPSENAYGWMQDCGDLYVRRRALTIACEYPPPGIALGCS